MRRKLVIVAGPPASGKTYIAERISKALGNVAYLNKDDLSPIRSKVFEITRQSPDMDGSFYKDNIRPAEYHTILKMAYSSLKYTETVVLDAPFLSEVQDFIFMQSIMEQTELLEAELLLV